jgi:flavin-dependent dehydrogenase
MELPDGDLELLELAMLAMNAEPDPGAEDRKGCSGHIGKMIYSAGVEQLAIVAYVPGNEHNKSAEKVDVTKWMDDVCEKVGAEVTKKATVVQSLVPNKNTGDLFGGTTGTLSGQIVVAVAKSNPETGKFALKDKDAAMAAAFAYLRTVGAFPEDEGDDSDDMVFGDDSNFDEYS